MIAAAVQTRNLILTGAITLVLLLGAVGGWSIFASIDGAVIAQGQIEVDQNKQIVQHPDGGVVAEIAVKEGQEVKAGDLLARLDGDVLQSQLVIAEGQLFDALSHQNRLEAERDDLPTPIFAHDLITRATTRPEIAEQIDGQRKLFFARKENLSRQVAQLEKRQEQIRSQIEGNAAQYNAALLQNRLIQEELTDQKTLQSKGLTQSSRVLALEREAVGLAGALGVLTASRAEAQGRATEVALEVMRLKSLRREEAGSQLRDLVPQKLGLTETRRALIERISRLEIRSPVAGMVLGLQVTSPRAVLRPADPLLYIVPQDRALIVTVMVPPIRRNDVRLGQSVRLNFPAFADQFLPDIHGRIVTISADTLGDPRTQAPFYRVQIALNQAEVAALLPLRLVPGMPTEAFIGTGKRSPLRYLMQPFTDYFTTAFRER